MKSVLNRIGEISVLTTFVFILGVIFGVYAMFNLSSAFNKNEDVFNIQNQEEGELVSILFLGDLMLDRYVALKIDQFGVEYPFENLREFLKSADFTVANAEGVFTNNKSVTKGIEKAPLVFTFATSTLPYLKEIGFSAFSQANNHNFDFGKSGQQESKNEIEKNGILVFGDYFNENPGPIFFEKNGEKVAIIGFNEFGYKNKEKIVEAIQVAKLERAFIVIFSHWGVEYKSEISTYQKNTAHYFIDNGADLIIGMHPHVIQPIEIYKDKVIFYSLGNFIFDQGFGETSKGLSVKVHFHEDRIVYELIPLVAGIGQTNLAIGDEKTKILQKLNNPEGLLMVTR